MRWGQRGTETVCSHCKQDAAPRLQAERWQAGGLQKCRERDRAACARMARPRTASWLGACQSLSGDYQSSTTSDGISVGVSGFSFGLSEGNNSDVRVGTRHQPGMARGLHLFESCVMWAATTTSLGRGELEQVCPSAFSWSSCSAAVMCCYHDRSQGRQVARFTV